MNFCDGCLNPEVTASKPGRDNYEVHNLISCDASARRKGFMGEYFIRPPVDITVDFSVPIDISHIKVGAQLEHMCTTGFSIFTRPEGCCQREVSSPVTSASYYSSSVSSADISASSSNTSSSQVPSSVFSPSTSFSKSSSSSSSIPTTSCISSSSCSASEETRVFPDTTGQKALVDDIYFCVGKFFTNGENELILRNYHYKHWIRTPLPAVENVTQSSRTFRGTVKHTNRQALRCVKSLLLRILRTSEKGPPVISSLEVWGQPSITTSKIDRKELFRKWATRNLSQETVLSIPRIYSSQTEKTKISKPVVDVPETKDISEVPEDFLDPLTCDIMTVPLLLPSGHSIDAHTLERYIASEGTWGRPASDPFTGVAFRADRQPTPNVHLKARIDRFLLLNGDHPDVEGCGRTVGSAFNVGVVTSGLMSGINKRPVEDAVHPYQPAIKTLQADEVVSRAENDMDLEKQVNTDDDCDSLETEIEKALEGKPKYIPETVKARNFNEPQKIGISEKSGNSAVKKKTSVSHGLVHSVNSASSTSVKSEQKRNMLMSGNGHRFVQMIGGALSVSQGKGVAARGLPTHQPNAKPSTLICGDSASKRFDLTTLNSVSCLCGEKDGLYKFPCDHILCRNCILHQEKKNLDVECVTCKKVCKRSHIIKYHKKSLFSS